jgi:hypothetical protein
MSFAVPDGTAFDGDFGLHDEWEVQPTLQSLLPKANAVLARYGLVPVTTEADIKLPVLEISSEVGDDEVSASNNRLFLALQPVLHEMSGMVPSWEDTSIHRNMGNFAEELVLLPSSYYQTAYSQGRTSGAYEEDLAHLDVPKFRLGIRVRPMRMNHSSTKDGKLSMVGSRNNWIPRRSRIKGIYEVFSLFQDSHLGVLRDEKFAYFPSEMGGSGKPIPFSEPSNFSRFNRAYKQGSYVPLNRELVRRLLRLLSPRDGDRLLKDELLNFTSRFKSQYHDWVKGRSIYAPVTWVDCPPELAVYKVRDLDDPLRVAAAATLLAAGKLVTESALAVRVEHNQLCKALLSSETIVELKARRDAKIAEWKTLSIYGLKSAGYIKELSLTSLGETELREDEVFSFMRGVKARRKLLKRLIRTEPLYYREAIDEVYKNGPMMVRFNMMPISHRIERIYAEHRFDIEDIEYPRFVQELETWFRGPGNGPAPSMLIEDDEKVIAEAVSNEICILITDDKALCKRTNMVAGCPVIRVPVEWYYRALYFGEEPEPWVASVKRGFPNWNVRTFEDTGSIRAGEERYFHDGSMCSRAIRHPISLTTFDWGKPRFTEVEQMDGDPSGPPEIYDRRNALGLSRGK